MNLKGVFLLIYFIICSLIFTNFYAGFFIKLSFLINTLLLTSIIIYHLYFEKSYSPFISAFIVFNFLFFIVAPIVQINSFYEISDPKFLNFFPYKENIVIESNFLIFIFNAIFIVHYILFKKKYLNFSFKPQSFLNKYTPIQLLFLATFCIITFFLSLSFILKDFATPSWQEYTFNVAELLLYKKVLFMIPFAGIIISKAYLSQKNKITNNTIVIFLFFIFFLIILFWFKNPFTEKRNALGPIYLSLLFLFFKNYFNSNVKTLSILFLIMVILFPISSMVTHSDASFSQIISNPEILIREAKFGGIFKTFNTLHYDAFSNINVTINYVRNNGISYGYQALSALLFFVPRSIWTSKPLSTGQLIGEDLIQNYGFNFSNLSNPLVSEGFVNFGYLGVIVFAILLSFTILFMLRWLNSNNLLKSMMSFYFAMHLLFLLRGDLTNGFSYYIGTLFGVLLIPKLIVLFIKEIYKLR